MKNLMLNNNNKSMDMFKLLTLSDPSFFFFPNTNDITSTNCENE